MQFYVRTKYEKPPPIQIVKETLKLSDGGIVAFDHFANNKGTFPSGFVSLKNIRIKIVFMLCQSLALVHRIIALLANHFLFQFL